jgi:hypothetical protein
MALFDRFVTSTIWSVPASDSERERENSRTLRHWLLGARKVRPVCTLNSSIVIHAFTENTDPNVDFPGQKRFEILFCEAVIS